MLRPLLVICFMVSYYPFTQKIYDNIRVSLIYIEVIEVTGQASDLFRWKARQYSLCKVQNNKSFFDDGRIEKKGIIFGIKMSSIMCTGCYRGYIATFGLDDKDRLTLCDLSFRVDDKQQRLEINGKGPSAIQTEGNNRHFYLKYTDLDYWLLYYSGSILIADGFIDKYYIHMGYQDPIYYETVFELTFKDGVLAGTKDFSEKAKRLQEEPRTLKKHNNDLDYIDELFDREYHEKW